MNKDEKRQKRIQIDLCGEVIYHSTLIESFLAKLILFIKFEQQDSSILKIDFGTMKFASKIKKVKTLLENYYPDVIGSYENLFDDLDIVKNFRNKIAHCQISWDDNESEYFYIWDIQTDESKSGMYVASKMTIQESIEELDFMVTTGNKLLSITKNFQERFNQKFETP